jgi:hypothetical protein
MGAAMTATIINLAAIRKAAEQERDRQLVQTYVSDMPPAHLVIDEAADKMVLLGLDYAAIRQAFADWIRVGDEIDRIMSE